MDRGIRSCGAPEGTLSPRYHPQPEKQNMANPSTDYSTIEPYHFFSSRDDKTKFNWFAFEWACEMDRAVPFQLKRYLSKNGYTQQTFNQSCIKLAVLLQGVVLRKLRNRTYALTGG
jgi:hypothetical protein